MSSSYVLVLASLRALAFRHGPKKSEVDALTSGMVSEGITCQLSPFNEDVLFPFLVTLPTLVTINPAKNRHFLVTTLESQEVVL